jgi:hypothetical protein
MLCAVCTLYAVRGVCSFLGNLPSAGGGEGGAGSRPVLKAAAAAPRRGNVMVECVVGARPDGRQAKRQRVKEAGGAAGRHPAGAGAATPTPAVAAALVPSHLFEPVEECDEESRAPIGGAAEDKAGAGVGAGRCGSGVEGSCAGGAHGVQMQKPKFKAGARKFRKKVRGDD